MFISLKRHRINCLIVWLRVSMKSSLEKKKKQEMGVSFRVIIRQTKSNMIKKVVYLLRVTEDKAI